MRKREIIAGDRRLMKRFLSISVQLRAGNGCVFLMAVGFWVIETVKLEIVGFFVLLQ